MSTIVVKHEDRTSELDAGATAIEALKALEAVRGQIVAARVDGEEWDLDRPVPDGATIEPIYADTEEGRAILRHSVAHLMAQAVTDLFPGAKWAIGPPVEDGFYYDFDVATPFTPDDLERIEGRMSELMKERQAFVREELSHKDALELFADQPYKREVIERVAAGGVEEDAVADSTADASSGGDGGPVFTVYRNMRSEDDEAWVDLCRGPHIPSSDRVPAFKLLRTAGAYWRGREDQPMLQRIYGTAWESRKALEAHLTMLEEARKRDHRKLGRELELVHFPEELGSGLAIFLPKGAIVRQQMEDWIRAEVVARGYEPVYTPHVAREDLWRISGHLENYAELMFPAMELDVERGSEPRVERGSEPGVERGSEPGVERGSEPGSGSAYRLKPMNCPFHILAYRSRTRSYRDLPIRLAELGTVYRFEKSGVVNGMLRARGFTQDDSHIFCRADQIVDEVVACIHFARDLYSAFGLGEPSRVAVSTRPEGKSVGSDGQWAQAEEALKRACEESGYDYEIDAGEGAFYGPKIDIHAKDAIGREWQLTTIQVDFTLPERFDMTYIGDDGEPHRPFMVHRALFGSIERFFAVMLESFNGAFPTWLAPVQVEAIPVAADFAAYALEVARALEAGGIRVHVDDSDDTLGNKIRKAKTSKVPYALVVGSEEVEARTVAVNPYAGDRRKAVPLDDFVTELVGEVAEGRAASGTA